MASFLELPDAKGRSRPLFSLTLSSQGMGRDRVQPGGPSPWTLDRGGWNGLHLLPWLEWARALGAERPHVVLAIVCNVLGSLGTRWSWVDLQGTARPSPVPSCRSALPPDGGGGGFMIIAISLLHCLWESFRFHREINLCSSFHTRFSTKAVFKLTGLQYPLNDDTFLPPPSLSTH